MSRLKTSSKIVNVIIALLFFLFAKLQLNDPDPIVWFSIYAVIGIMFVYSTFRLLPNWILYLTLAGTLGFAIYHLPYFLEWIKTENKSELFGEMQSERYYIEGTREFMGLLIVLLALTYLLIQNRKRLRKNGVDAN